MNAMIFAAGLGTRLKPLTDTMPKALVPVAGETLLAHVVNKLKAAGAEHVVVNVHHFAEQIEDYLAQNDNFGIDIQISDERQQLLETGGGLKKALPLFADRRHVLIHNVDILSNVDLRQFYQQSLANEVTLLVSRRKTKRYLLFDDDMTLVGWTNIETGEVRSPYADLVPQHCQMFAFSGIHCVSCSLSSLMEGWQERFPIMDFYLRHCAEVKIKGIAVNDLKLMDVGKLDTISEAEDFLRDLNTNI